MQIQDFQTPTWLTVAGWAQKRLDTLRMKNDGLLDPLETALVRGQIKQLKELLGLPAAVARAASAESAE